MKNSKVILVSHNKKPLMWMSYEMFYEMNKDNKRYRDICNKINKNNGK